MALRAAVSCPLSAMLYEYEGGPRPGLSPLQQTVHAKELECQERACRGKRKQSAGCPITAMHTEEGSVHVLSHMWQQELL